MKLFAALDEGLGDRRTDAAPFVSKQGEQADGRLRRWLGVYLNAATLIGAKIIDKPQISTTRGQITCVGLMYRFIIAIQ